MSLLTVVNGYEPISLMEPDVKSATYTAGPPSNADRHSTPLGNLYNSGRNVQQR